MTNTEQIAAMAERIEKLEGALRGIVLVCGSTGDSFHDFEEQAEVFYKETGWMRPGKDIPAAWGTEDSSVPEARRERYAAWVKEKLDAARALLSSGDQG